MKSSVALIGFMGTGKTSVGRALAEYLGKTFFELDVLIQRKAGKDIPAIFREDGEIAFRELEIETVKDISREENAVIACGGGVVLNKINIDRLKQRALVVHLEASPRIILKRISGDGEERPLLATENPALTIRELMRYRRPFYQRAADININTSGQDIDSVVLQVAAGIKEYEGIAGKKQD